MCGIIVARDFTEHNVNGVIWTQFEKQKTRGVEGFGAFDGSSIFKTPKLKKMRGWLRNKKHGTDFMMFHHRWPTSTANVRRAAHPFSTGDYFGDTKYVLVHNGHVSNSFKLREKHEALGIKYTSELEDGTFNDSESLLWDVALTLEGKQDKLEAYGGIAFVAAKVVDNEISHLYFAKNPGRPLNLFRDKMGMMLSSEGEGESIKDHELYTYNYKLNRLTHHYFRVPSYSPIEATGTYKSPYKYQSGYPYSSSSTTFGFGGGGRSHLYSKDDLGVQDIDYYLNSKGERVYYDNNWDDAFDALVWDEDNELTISHEDTSGEKSLRVMMQEASEQDSYLQDYVGVFDQDLRPKDIYDCYMTASNGSYIEAFDLMDTDLDYFTGHAPTPKCQLITEALEGAMRMMCQEDNMYNEEEVDENYFSPVPMVVKPFSNQLSLLGAGQEG